MTLPDVIFLNGSSSAGKSSISRELQARLPQPYMHFGIDHIIRRAPLRLHDHENGFKLVRLPNGEVPMRLGHDAEQMLRAWRRMMAVAVAEGLRIILDEVIFEDEMLTDWLEVLEGADVFFVGVRCDLAELQRREIARGDREEGQARAQFNVIHRHDDYDLQIDTTETSAADSVTAILAALIARRAGPSAFERLRART